MKQSVKLVIVKALLSAKDILDSNPKLKRITFKAINHIPYLGARLKNLGKNGAYRHEVKEEKELSLQSRTIYRDLKNALNENTEHLS